MSLPPAYTSQPPTFGSLPANASNRSPPGSLPPAYISQPPTFGSLPANATNNSSYTSLPPAYSSEVPPNHLTVPNPYPGAIVPNPQGIVIQAESPPPLQVQQQAHAQPQAQASTLPTIAAPSIFPHPVVPQTVMPQTTIPQPYPQIIYPQPQPQVPRPFQYSTPHYLINGVPSGPVLPTIPVYTSISHPYTLFPSPYLLIRPQPQNVSPYPSPYPPTYASYQYQQPQINFQPQVPTPHIQHQVTQQPMMTHQGTVFQEHGYPGPGSLPPGGRWAVTTDDGKRTLWTILSGETRPAAWAYPGDAR